jgi:hypothetical protein
MIGVALQPCVSVTASASSLTQLGATQGVSQLIRALSPASFVARSALSFLSLLIEQNPYKSKQKLQPLPIAM